MLWAVGKEKSPPGLSPFHQAFRGSGVNAPAMLRICLAATAPILTAW